MLEQLQRKHAEIYGLDHELGIADFLVTGAHARAAGAARTMSETVLVRGSRDALELAVYVDEHVLQRLAAANPLDDLSDDVLGDLWLAIEGVSHFNYLVFNATRATAVSLLELELQAEIDKFVGTLALADEQGYRNVEGRLFERLFECTRLGDGLSDAERERYTVATRYAAAYCRALSERRRSNPSSIAEDLRAFFRLDRSQKVSRIHALSLRS